MLHLWMWTGHYYGVSLICTGAHQAGLCERRWGGRRVPGCRQGPMVNPESLGAEMSVYATAYGFPVGLWWEEWRSGAGRVWHAVSNVHSCQAIWASLLVMQNSQILQNCAFAIISTNVVSAWRFAICYVKNNCKLKFMILLPYLWLVCCHYIIMSNMFLHYQNYDSKEELSEKSPRIHRML